MSKLIVLSFVLILLSINQSQATSYLLPGDSTSTVEQDSLSKFAKMNEKMMNFFVYAPFPMFSYSQETGQVIGLVKYNLIDLIEADTVSSASSFSALMSFSSLGQFKFVIGSRMYFSENKIVVQGEANYIHFPQFAFGVGNEINLDNLEEIESASYNFDNSTLFATNEEKTLYLGVYQQLSYYSDVKLDSNSYFLETEYHGYEGGISSGLGPGFILDKRDHKYNTNTGYYIESSVLFYSSAVGSEFNFTKFEFDARYFINPWMKHVFGVQAYTQSNSGEVPFYALSEMGGTNRMRGYYQGAIRDKVIADFQAEYRMPLYGAFGLVAFAGAGRVGDQYKDLSFDDLYYSGGIGLRIMVDKTNRANLRMDYGIGRKMIYDGEERRVNAFTLGFTEAF
ncbi:MAG: outer membrane protein assembly factor [Reichenbachiella sp.]